MLDEFGRCRVCGAPRNWAELVRPPWERRADAEGWSRFSQFDAGTVGAAIKAGATYEKRRPTRPAKLESDVWVPVAQAAFSGVIGALLAGTGAGLLGQGWRSLLWSGIGGAVTLGASWFIILGEHRRALEEVERIVGRDLNGDGMVGSPSPGPRDPITVESVERDDKRRLRRIRYVTLPVGVTDGDLERLARAVLVDGAAFSRRGLADVVSGEKYGGISKAMLGGGLLGFVNGKNEYNGLVLTFSGRAFLRQYLSSDN